MLQRPRDISINLPAHALCARTSNTYKSSEQYLLATSENIARRHRNRSISRSTQQYLLATPEDIASCYRDKSISTIQLTKLSEFHYHSWNKTTIQLASKWAKTIAQRQSRVQNLKRRSMVKLLACERNDISDSGNLRRESVSSTITLDPAHGNEPRLSGTGVDQENFEAYDGQDQVRSSDWGEVPENIVAMEQNKAEAGIRQSKKGQENQKLTAEEYIAQRRVIAVELVMARFQRWLDKRLAIISYTIEAAEASETSDGTSNGDRPTGSTNQDTGENKSGRSGGRPKRQLSDGDDPDEFSAGGDDNGQDRGGNKRARKDTDSKELKFACPFHKHNPGSNKKPLCMKGGWKSIHRLKEHLYRVHLLPKHRCPRCNWCFQNNKELQAHLCADEPCKKSSIVPEEGIDADTEKKLRERKKHNAGTETQRWNEMYLLLFPNADHNALPSPYSDYDETGTRSSNLERFKREEARIKKVLPRLVRQQVERKFKKTEVEALHGLSDIIRSCVSQAFRNDISQDAGSSTTTPQTGSRATTPGLSPADEPRLPLAEHSSDPFIDLSYWVDGGAGDFTFSSDLNILNFDNNQFDLDNGSGEYGADKVSLDSGYGSRTTTGFP